jgi:methyltransferase
MGLAHIILLFVALQRGLELVYASRNTARLKQRGAIEVGRRHYPFVVLLHIAWLVAMAAGIYRHPMVRLLPLVLFALLQALRVWVIVTLGRFWTTRIISVDDEPLVRHGPYRYFRHPNYLVVTGEMAGLPLVFDQTANALIFSVLNLVVLAWRIHVENAALEARHGSHSAP